MIRLTGVTKTVTDGRKKQRVVDDVHLTIQPGEFVAIVGPSGSGKSTLLNLLGLLDKPTRGEYRFHQELVSRFSASKAATFRSRRIGFVFQAFMLLPRMSVAKNVELPLLYVRMRRRDRKERVQEALSLVGMSTKSRRKAAILSGGEKQRVAIARALVNAPDLILADEPTGNLDDKSKAGILDIFLQLQRAGKTIVMVTHDLEAAQVASRVLRIRQGRLKEIAHPSEGARFEVSSTSRPDAPWEDEETDLADDPNAVGESGAQGT